MLTLVLVISTFLTPLIQGTEQQPTSTRVAVLDLGQSTIATVARDRVLDSLKGTTLSILDPDQSRAAARGLGYDGSLNLERRQAKELGAVLGAEFYVTGDVQTIKRSPSSGFDYFESYATLFVVSSRTGNLVTWLRPCFQARTAAQSEKLLLDELSGPNVRNRTIATINRARDKEQLERDLALSINEPTIEEAPDELQAAAEGLRLPRPFRRIRPSYTDDAAQAEVEATVDIIADIDVDGDVNHAHVERWAGFGLDEATLEAVMSLRFFPAMRKGSPVPIRVLLRYNFRKQAPSNQHYNATTTQ